MRTPVHFLKMGVPPRYNYSTQSINTNLITKSVFLERNRSSICNLGRKASYRADIMTKSHTSISFTPGVKKSFSSNRSIGNDNATKPPTRDQLRIFAIANALPMVGFGFMDQTVMIQAGNAIDCSIGVTFGFSTITAAAVGQVCSNAAGILFGGTIGNLAKAAGLPSSNLTSLQRTLPVIKQIRMAAQLAGVLLGCSLGLINLLLIDTERSSSLKLKNIAGDDEDNGNGPPDFEVEASNDKRKDATTFVVKGPDIDGLIANMTDVLSANGCSLLELSAGKLKTGDDGGGPPGRAGI